MEGTAEAHAGQLFLREEIEQDWSKKVGQAQVFPQPTTLLMKGSLREALRSIAEPREEASFIQSVGIAPALLESGLPCAYALSPPSSLRGPTQACCTHNAPLLLTCGR